MNLHQSLRQPLSLLTTWDRMEINLRLFLWLQKLMCCPPCHVVVVNEETNPSHSEPPLDFQRVGTDGSKVHAGKLGSEPPLEGLSTTSGRKSPCRGYLCLPRNPPVTPRSLWASESAAGVKLLKVLRVAVYGGITAADTFGSEPYLLLRKLFNLQKPSGDIKKLLYLSPLSL